MANNRRITRKCDSCPREFIADSRSKVFTCSVCVKYIEEDGGENVVQPKNKADYIPRFNGMRPFEHEDE